MVKNCQMKGCSNTSLNSFCVTHLNEDSTDLLLLTDMIKVNPTSFVTGKVDKLKEINVFAKTSSLKLKRSRKKTLKIKKSIQASIDHNQSMMEVVKLTKHKESPKSWFFAPSASFVENQNKTNKLDWKDSSKFTDYCMKLVQHQIFLDDQTNEVVFFIPSLSWQQKVFADKARPQ